LDLAVILSARRLLAICSYLLRIERDPDVSIAKNKPDLLERFAFGLGANQPDERDEHHKETKIYQEQSVGQRQWCQSVVIQKGVR
jgi:hypothetical protein